MKHIHLILNPSDNLTNPLVGSCIQDAVDVSCDTMDNFLFACFKYYSSIQGCVVFTNRFSVTRKYISIESYVNYAIP